MHHVQNQYNFVLVDTMDEDVVVRGETTQTRTQIIVTAQPNVRIPGQ